jgi:hypothetical protein
METWSISWAVRNLLSELLTPPGILIVWVLLMLFLIKKLETGDSTDKASRQ